LPGDANAEGIGAEYKDGILTIAIPKQEEKAAKSTIQIK
jgi:HSP20 family molecular chaperone IbpA